MLPTGRNASSALATIPADQKQKFDELANQVGPIAEVYVVETLLGPWWEVKQRLMPEGLRVAPEVHTAIERVESALDRIPGEILVELTAPKSSKAFNAAGYEARKALDHLLEVVTPHNAGATRVGEVQLLRDLLDSQTLVDGAAARMP